MEEDDDGNLIDMTWEPVFTVDPEVDIEGARAELDGVLRRMLRKSCGKQSETRDAVLTL